MTYRKFITKHILILLLSVISTENLSAIMWSSYLPRWMATREHSMPEQASLLGQLASLMRPQLNYEWLNRFSFGQGLSRLSGQWSSLTPAQKNIFLYMALFGAGGAGMAFWGRQFQQRASEEHNRQPLKDPITSAKDEIVLSIDDINQKLNRTNSINELDSLSNQLEKHLQTLENIKDKLAVETYDQISAKMATLAQEIENNRERRLRNEGKSPDEVIAESIAEQEKQKRQSYKEFEAYLPKAGS